MFFILFCLQVFLPLTFLFDVSLVVDVGNYPKDEGENEEENYYYYPHRTLQIIYTLEALIEFIAVLLGYLLAILLLIGVQRVGHHHIIFASSDVHQGIFLDQI